MQPCFLFFQHLQTKGFLGIECAVEKINTDSLMFRQALNPGKKRCGADSSRDPDLVLLPFSKKEFSEIEFAEVETPIWTFYLDCCSPLLLQ